MSAGLPCVVGVVVDFETEVGGDLVASFEAAGWGVGAG